MAAEVHVSNVLPRFPAGTVLTVYEGTLSDSGVPRPYGSLGITGTVGSEGAVAFTGLPYDRALVAAAEVAGEWEFLGIETQSEGELSPEQLQEEVKALEVVVDGLREQTEALTAKVGNLRAVNVLDYGAVGDGTTDDAAALLAAAAAWEASGGILEIPRGTYKSSQGEVFKITRPDQSIEGHGQGATILKPTSAVSGPLITWSCLPASDHAAGMISGLTIDGENAAENAVGLRLGDLVGHSLHNVVVRNFTKAGQVGIQLRNIAYWTEEFNWANITLDNNKTGLEVLRTEAGNTSFGYNTINGLRLNVFAGQCGIRVRQDVKLYNGSFRITGNLHGNCVGIEIADTSQVWGLLDITLETNEAGATPIKHASGALLKGAGYVDVGVGGGISESANLENIRLNGVVRIPGIKTASDLFRVTGPVKNIKPAAEATVKEVVEALEESGLVS